MHEWPGTDGITAGKDLKAGGTWLGFNTLGEVSALTNIRDLSAIQDDRLSRGELVLKALKGELSEDWLKQHCDSYNPFNLLYEQHSQLYVFNSRSKTNTLISDGFHAVSNGDLDDIWPKMARGKIALEQIIVSQQLIPPESLLPMMLDQTLPPEDSLPNTGVSLEWERRLSSIFISHPEYGTRSTSILLWHRSGKFECLEVRYNPKGKELSRDKFRLQLTQSEE